MAKSATVTVELLADADQYKRGMAEAGQATDKFDKKTQTTTDKVKGFGSMVHGVLAVGAVTAIASFAKSAITAFSNVEQSAGSVEAVFGEAADSIKAQAAGAAEAFGLSASEFQSSAALIGSMLKNQMGLSAEEAAEKVSDLTGKAADMAATFGGTTAEAVAAIGSLMRGERDPIEKYGVSMNDASISAHALETGLVDSTAAMTPQIKAAAALDLLYEQTGDSAGQFAEESDTLAGKAQILTAKIENAKAAIGEQLAPAVGLAGDAIDVMIPLVETLTSAMGGAAEATVPLIDELKTMIGLAPEAGGGLEDVGGAIAHTLLPFLGPITMGIANVNEVLGLNAEKTAEAWRGMEDARTHGIEPLIDAEGDLVIAEEGLQEAIRETIDARQDGFDQMRAQLDPFFAYTEAIDAQAEAQAGVTAATEEFGDKSPEHISALKELAEKTLAVEEAELEMAAAGGITRAEFEKQRIKMGLTAREAQLLIDKYDIIFKPRTVTHRINFRRQPTPDNPFNIPGQHTGGTVQGAFRGQEVPIIARAGEHVSQGGRPANGHDGGPMVIQFNVDGRKLFEQVVLPEQVKYNKRNGRPV